MNKKIISAVLAGAMAISTFGIVASAADEGIESKNTLTAIAGLNSQKINAKIPAAITAALNPYKAVITKDTNAVADSFADGVASPVYEIENKDTSKGLNVSVTPSITKTTLAISEEPIAADVTEKTIFAWLNTTTLKVGTDPLFRNSAYDESDKSQAVFKEEGTLTKDIMSIDKSASGYFRIQGDLTAELDEGESWTAKDTATFSIILDLAASAGEVKDASLSALTVTGAGTLAPAFDTAVTSYKIPATTTKTTLSVGGTLTDTSATGATFNVYLNNKLSAGSFSPAANTGVVTAASVFPTGVTSYKVGDVITVVVKNGEYTKAYTIEITPES